jgi:hypothetical protein
MHIDPEAVRNGLAFRAYIPELRKVFELIETDRAIGLS